jgi:hypothetical protein
MKMPGFIADVSLGQAASQYRAGFHPFPSRGAVLPQMDAVVLDETYEEGGTTTHVKVTVFTPFDPNSVPAFFEAFGLSEKGSSGAFGSSRSFEREIRESAGTYTQAKTQRCIQECSRIYSEKKLACAAESDPRACEANAYWDYWDCYGLCSPL